MEELTKEQIKAFDGMNQANIEMMEKLEKMAPRCHMKPMFLEEADVSDYHSEQWWECSVCGHTKEVEWN